MKPLIFLFTLFQCGQAWSFFGPSVEPNQVFQSLKSYLFKNKKWPEQLTVDEEKVNITYSLDQDLNKYITSQLGRYRPDFASVVVMDNDTGKILATVDYKRDKAKKMPPLALNDENPAASIIKIISTANLLENDLATSNTPFTYRGRKTTLYRHQLKNKRTRWTRKETLKMAFAKSNNVIFGKAAVNKMVGASFLKTAEKFGFNESLLPFDLIEPSYMKEPGSQYDFAQLASGLNRVTTLSPVHGAAIASVIANEGKLIYPSVVESIKVDGEKIYGPKKKEKQVIGKDTADELAKMMNLTLKRGTARKAFARELNRGVFRKLEVGGKTGAMTGGKPYGKRDWFVAWAKPKDVKKDAGISVCVMIINQKKWYVKSSFLAKTIIKHYFKRNLQNRKTIGKKGTIVDTKNS